MNRKELVKSFFGTNTIKFFGMRKLKKYTKFLQREHSAKFDMMDARQKMVNKILLDGGTEYIIEIIKMSDGTKPRYIHCLICNHKSYNENDIKNKYCGHCCRFLKNKEK